MKLIIFLLFSVLFISCDGQKIKVPDKVPYGTNPAIPSKASLDALNKVEHDSLKVSMKDIGNGRSVRIYSLDGSLFTGWSSQLFKNTEHKFRYTKIDEGLAVWQIGYFDNGEIGHDFHMKDGLGYGRQRMWQKGGGLYIDTYSLEGEIPHGKHLAWHNNGVLSRDAFFENGKLIYEVLFDTNGVETERKGTVPDENKE